MAAMIGRLHHVVFDCPDPLALAGFYAELLGMPLTYRSPEFAVVARDETSSGLAFQLARDHRPPQWPDAAHPQQIHLDVMVGSMPTPRGTRSAWCRDRAGPRRSAPSGRGAKPHMCCASPAGYAWNSAVAGR